MIHCFTGLLTTCSLIHMNDLLYVHTGYVWYTYQLEGSTAYQSRAKQKGFFYASIIILSLFWFSLLQLYFRWFVLFLVQFPSVLNQSSLSIRIFSSLCWKNIHVLQPAFLDLAFGAAFAVFLTLEMIRVRNQLFYLSKFFLLIFF
jgi:hypothetical protein